MMVSRQEQKKTYIPLLYGNPTQNINSMLPNGNIRTERVKAHDDPVDPD